MALRFRLISAAVFVLGLCGCHADVTERIVANPDNTVTVTYREALDAQLYSAVAKIGGADPLHETSARNAGWKVAESVTAAGERVVSYSKTAPANQVQSLTLTSNNSKTVDGFDFSPASAFPFSIALSKISTGAQTIPALLYPDRVLTRPGHDPDAAAAAANAARNAGAVDSVVSVHLELKGPYRVTATNGQRLADGAVRWDLYFAKPISIEYTSGPLTARIAAAFPSVAAGRPDRNDPSTPPAPAQADWSAVYASGVNYGSSPVAAWQNVGEGGTYDFMRWGKAAGGLNNDYRQAAKFAIGVYLNGAGIPESVMTATMDLLSQ